MIIHDCLNIKVGKYYVVLSDLYRSGDIVVYTGTVIKASYHYDSFEEWQFKDNRGKLFSSDIRYKDLSGKIRTLYKNEMKSQKSR